MKEYKFKGKRGIDDLQGVYAFVGNSQGDTSNTNDIETYKASKGWLSFVFDCHLDQENINKERERRIENNSKYISQLLKEGRFGEEYENSIKIEGNSLFDAPVSDKLISSYSFKILDLSK